MEELYQQLWQLRKDCENFGNQLTIRFGSNNLREHCFATIFNKATVTIELLSYYRQIWSQTHTGNLQEIEQARQENAERCIEITKWLFIGAVSSVEFHIRQIISLQAEHPLSECISRREKLIDHFDKIYQNLASDSQGQLKPFRILLKDTPPFDSFARILDASEKQGLLSSRSAEIWRFAVEVRNCTIHNNAVAWRNINLQLGEQNFELNAGIMTRGKLDFFSVMTSSILACTFEWIQNL